MVYIKIDYFNKNIIGTEETYIHDSCFDTIEYKYDKKEIIIVLKNDYFNKKNIIMFKKVLYVESKNFELINGNAEIIDWCLNDKDSNYNKIIQVRETHGQCLNKIVDEEKTIDSYIYMSNGNIISILCEEIIFEETNK